MSELCARFLRHVCQTSAAPLGIEVVRARGATLWDAGGRAWLDTRNMGTDNGVHFPVVGQLFVETGAVRAARVGNADAMLFSARDLVDFAESYFRRVLA